MPYWSLDRQHPQPFLHQQVILSWKENRLVKQDTWCREVLCISQEFLSISSVLQWHNSSDEWMNKMVRNNLFYKLSSQPSQFMCSLYITIPHLYFTGRNPDQPSHLVTIKSRWSVLYSLGRHRSYFIQDGRIHRFFFFSNKSLAKGYFSNPGFHCYTLANT